MQRTCHDTFRTCRVVWPSCIWKTHPLEFVSNHEIALSRARSSDSAYHTPSRIRSTRTCTFFQSPRSDALGACVVARRGLGQMNTRSREDGRPRKCASVVSVNICASGRVYLPLEVVGSHARPLLARHRLSSRATDTALAARSDLPSLVAHTAWGDQDIVASLVEVGTGSSCAVEGRLGSTARSKDLWVHLRQT